MPRRSAVVAGIVLAITVERIYPLDRGSTLSRLELSLHDQTSVNIHHRVVWPDGTLHWLAWTGRIYRNADGAATRVLGIIHDTMGRADE